jgi:hypothetical protein
LPAGSFASPRDARARNPDSWGREAGHQIVAYAPHQSHKYVAPPILKARSKERIQGAVNLVKYFKYLNLKYFSARFPLGQLPLPFRLEHGDLSLTLGDEI